MWPNIVATASEPEVGGGVPPWVLITGQVCTLVAAVVASVLGYRAVTHARTGAQQAASANIQATQANDAVNHSHENGEVRIFDMVADTRTQVKELNLWKERWDGLPEQLSNAESLMTHFAVIEDRIDTSARHLHKRIDQLDYSNTSKHDEISRVLTEHINRTEPQIEALGAAVASMETKAEAETRTTGLVETLESNLDDREVPSGGQEDISAD